MLKPACLCTVDAVRSKCSSLCLQAGGGKRAGAVATVVAAVDLARVRQPVHVEGGAEQEEVEAVEVELRQSVDQRHGGGWMSTRTQSAQEFTAEATLPRPQVS